MEKQTAVEKLKKSIRLLEIQQANEGEQLKEQFKATYESLRFVNFFKTSLKEFGRDKELKNNLLESIISIMTGYLTSRLSIFQKAGPFRKLFGTVLQMGASKLLIQNSTLISSFINSLVTKLFNSKKEPHEAEI